MTAPSRTAYPWLRPLLCWRPVYNETRGLTLVAVWRPLCAKSSAKALHAKSQVYLEVYITNIELVQLQPDSRHTQNSFPPALQIVSATRWYHLQAA